MSVPNNEGHHMKRIVLPSGKTIEVVYFPDDQTAAPNRALHVCPECSSELVYPVSWEEASDTSWELELRCPNCEWEHVAVYEQEVVECFDEELDEGTDALVRDLRRLAHANMEDEVERFIKALRADAILPEDFAV